MSKTGITIACALLSVLLYSCSLKEDRWECPCILHLSTDTGTSAPGAVFLEYSITDRTRTCISLVREIRGKDDSLTAEVGRGEVNIGVVASSEKYPGADMVIPLGSQASVMYAAFHSDCCDEEENSVRMVLCKQFAYIDLTVTGGLDSIPECSIAVKGNVCGWKKRDMSLLRGDFCIKNKPDDRNKILFMVPRQIDNSLELCFLGADDTEVLSTCRIGEEICSRGYDWTAKNLKDIRMNIQYSEAEIKIIQCEWYDGTILDIEI